jgi:Xaa-Pro dipeptidase
MTTQAVAAPTPLLDLERARQLLAESGVDAIVASSVANIYYLSGFLAFDVAMDPQVSSFAVLPRDPDGELAITVAVGALAQLRDFPSWATRVVPFGDFFISGMPPTSTPPVADAVSALADALEQGSLGGGRVGFELESLPAAVLERIRTALPSVQVVDASSLLRRLRSRKTPLEVERLRRATTAVEAAIATALAEIRAGLTELDVDRRVRELLVAADVQPTSVFVGAAERGAYVASWATDRPIRRGDLVRIDVTAAYGMYHADLSRNVAIGTATGEQRRLYAASRAAMEAAADAVAVGVPVGEIHAAAVAAGRAAGLADFRRHNVGHGLGLQVHEGPPLGPGDARIEPDSVISVEAPYYLHGSAGYSPEDTLFVSTAGIERWTTAPAELPVLG